MKCNYGKRINLLYTLPGCEQINNVILDNALVEGLLDFFFYSKYLVLSPDQPGFNGCVFIGIIKWTWDERGLNKTNSVFSPIGFPLLKNMIDIQSRIFFYKYSHTLSISNILHNDYRKILKVIDEANGKIEFNKEKISNKTFLAALE